MNRLVATCSYADSDMCPDTVQYSVPLLLVLNTTRFRKMSEMKKQLPAALGSFRALSHSTKESDSKRPTPAIVYIRHICIRPRAASCMLTLLPALALYSSCAGSTRQLQRDSANYYVVAVAPGASLEAALSAALSGGNFAEILAGKLGQAQKQQQQNPKP